jgi:hypothetical protein
MSVGRGVGNREVPHVFKKKRASGGDMVSVRPSPGERRPKTSVDH